MLYSIRQYRDRDQDRQDKDDAELEAAREADSFSFGPKQVQSNTRGSAMKTAVPVSFLECHSALDRPAKPVIDDLAPRVLETLTWLEGERYDMTLDEAFDVLRLSWKKVHGRTERQLILQIASLLASQSGVSSDSPPAK